tara:strand:+ start:6055 stop:6300 length:246 start_codon:yes stop_codon:yes gene_type:complete
MTEAELVSAGFTKNEIESSCTTPKEYMYQKIVNEITMFTTPSNAQITDDNWFVENFVMGFKSHSISDVNSLITILTQNPMS